MSFLGDLVNSIGGDKAPAPPFKPPSRPASTNSTISNPSKIAPSTPAASALSAVKPTYKGVIGTLAPQQGGSLKRKADDITTERPVKLPKPSPSLQSISDHGLQKSSLPSGSATKSPVTLKPSNGLPSPAAQSAVKAPVKAPAKGSYAELMAKAKEAQSSKAPNSIGMIKHQTTDKLKPSKLAERRKQDKEKAKGAPPGSLPSKVGLNGKADPRRRSASPVKKSEVARIPKKPSAPLHGPARPEYKGTINQAPKKSKDDIQQNKKKSSRYDEYSDEDEDEDDPYGYGDNDNGHGYSDESDDMEGGFDDVQAEERAADRQARLDDAKELALENKLRSEKEERKRKLTAMAARRK